MFLSALKQMTLSFFYDPVLSVPSSGPEVHG